MKVLVAQPLPQPSTVEILLEHEVVVLDRPLHERDFVRLLGDVDALLATPPTPVTRELLAAAPRIRIVANCAVGTDNIDLEACRERKIVVTNTPGVLTESTADLTWALLLAVARRVCEGDRLVRSEAWTGWKPTELLGLSLQGKTLGIFGAGRIGKAVARRGAAFGMEILESRREGGAEMFERLLSESDFLTLHTPLTVETRGRFGREEFSRMKPGAILINTARGNLVDDAALVEALEEGRLRGAGLDVYENEPAIHPGLRLRPDVVLLPHIGSATFETRLLMARMACEEIVRIFSGRPPVHVVLQDPPA